MHKRAFIFGAGGHARVIASLLPHFIEQVIFVDLMANGEQVISEAQFFNDLDQYREAPVYLGIGNNEIRERLFHELKQAGITPANCISEKAFVAREVELGLGVVICPGAVVGTGAKIGDNVIINTLAGVDHDCQIGDHSQVAPGTVLGGGVRVGARTMIGMGSTILPGITLGDEVVVRAGSLVHKDVADGKKVGGNPAVEIPPR